MPMGGIVAHPGRGQRSKDNFRALKTTAMDKLQPGYTEDVQFDGPSARLSRSFLLMMKWPAVTWLEPGIPDWPSSPFKKPSKVCLASDTKYDQSRVTHRPISEKCIWQWDRSVEGVMESKNIKTTQSWELRNRCLLQSDQGPCFSVPLLGNLWSVDLPLCQWLLEGSLVTY